MEQMNKKEIAEMYLNYNPSFVSEWVFEDIVRDVERFHEVNQKTERRKAPLSEKLIIKLWGEIADCNLTPIEFVRKIERLCSGG